MKSVPTTTDVVSSNLDQGKVYNFVFLSLAVTCDMLVIFSGYFGFRLEHNHDGQSLAFEK
jgi:hypothetical protein